MRVHVYSEELTDEIAIVERTTASGQRFLGLRTYLKSPSELDHTPEDDDRSAVTYWFSSVEELRRFARLLYSEAAG
jgi:hypothetical protein